MMTWIGHIIKNILLLPIFFIALILWALSSLPLPILGSMPKSLSLTLWLYHQLQSIAHWVLIPAHTYDEEPIIDNPGHNNHIHIVMPGNLYSVQDAKTFFPSSSRLRYILPHHLGTKSKNIDALIDVYAQCIQNILNEHPQTPIQLSGHSMGGAILSLSLAKIIQNNPRTYDIFLDRTFTSTHNIFFSSGLLGHIPVFQGILLLLNWSIDIQPALKILQEQDNTQIYIHHTEKDTVISNGALSNWPGARIMQTHNISLLNHSLPEPDIHDQSQYHSP
jgi:hypothetical protein